MNSVYFSVLFIAYLMSNALNNVMYLTLLEVLPNVIIEYS